MNGNILFTASTAYRWTATTRTEKVTSADYGSPGGQPPIRDTESVVMDYFGRVATCMAKASNQNLFAAGVSGRQSAIRPQHMVIANHRGMATRYLCHATSDIDRPDFGRSDNIKTHAN